MAGFLGVGAKLEEGICYNHTKKISMYMLAKSMAKPPIFVKYISTFFSFITRLLAKRQLLCEEYVKNPMYKEINPTSIDKMPKKAQTS